MKALNVILWLVLIIITYNKYIDKINLSNFTSFELITSKFITGEFVLFVAWTISVMAAYSIAKYMLIVILPASKFFLKIYLKYLIPVEYRSSALVLYYRKIKDRSNEHHSKIREYISKQSSLEGRWIISKISLLTGLVLKLNLILITVYENYDDRFRYVIIIAICITVLSQLILLNMIISSEGKTKLKNIVS